LWAGGAKGVKNKNIRRISGKPLIQYTLECAAKSKLVDHFVVSTDSIDIFNLVNSLGYETKYIRPAELASDTSGKIDAIKHVVDYFESTSKIAVDIIVDLDIGVPMRTPQDIDAAIDLMVSDNEMETLVTVYPSERSPYFNMIEQQDNGYYNLVKLPNPPIFRRQDAPKVFSVTPAIFAWKRNSLHIKHLYEGNWGVYEMPIERSLDIDTEFEFKMVEFLMTQNLNIE
jgi:CMP-N-acetylneuraminic acid synthetase